MKRDAAEIPTADQHLPAMLQTNVNSSNIQLKLQDCGTSKTLGRMKKMEPTSVKQGVNQKLTLSGPLKRTVPGGKLDLTVKMTSFPYSTLGSLKNADICKDHTVKLKAMGLVSGGTLKLKGLKCPIKKGTVKYIAYLKMERSNAAKVSIRAKHKSSNLLCSNILSGR
jgi:hypothetical protein